MIVHFIRRYFLATGASALLLCSCAHRTKLASAPPIRAFDRQVTNAQDAGDGDILVKALRDNLIAHPDDLAVRLELGKAYQKRGYPELAIEHYRLAAAKFPKSAETQLLLAKGLRSEGRPFEAADTLEVFLDDHPQTLPKYSSWLGIMRDELGEWTRGEAAHRAALALSPTHDDLHNNLGYCLLMQGRKDEAAEEFRAALKVRPDSKLARNNLASALAAKPAEAVSNLQTGSDPATAHNNMAALLIEQNKYAEARKELELALGYNKVHSAALNNLKLISMLDGKPASVPAKAPQKRWVRLRHAWARAVSGREPGWPVAASQAGT